MRFRLLVAAFAVLALAACSRPADKAPGAQAGAAKADDPAFHDKVVAYLTDHPGVIQEAITAYNDKQHKDMVAKASVAITARRQDLQADARDFVANPDGKITVVEFFDYRCPYCKADQVALQGLIAQDKDIRFVFKEYPIIPDKDGQIGVSLRAAQAALAAKRAGKYLPVHDALMSAPDLDDAAITQIMRQHGIDPLQASTTPDDLHQLTDVRKLAQDVHVAGTPTFIVGDTLVDTSSMPQLAAAIEQARKASKS
jgi:protein-disulfide isomerase